MSSETLNNETAKIKSALKLPVKLLLPIIFIVAVIIVIFSLHHSPKTASGCDALFRNDTVLRTAKHVDISVEIAADDAAQEHGLSGRSCLPPHSGMLFSFNQSGYYQFWMKDMRMPLDILWLDGNHRIVTVRSAITPSSYPQNFTSTLPAQYVLELASGQAADLSLSTGSILTF